MKTMKIWKRWEERTKKELCEIGEGRKDRMKDGKIRVREKEIERRKNEEMRGRKENGEKERQREGRGGLNQMGKGMGRGWVIGWSSGDGGSKEYRQRRRVNQLVLLLLQISKSPSEHLTPMKMSRPSASHMPDSVAFLPSFPLYLHPL